MDPLRLLTSSMHELLGVIIFSFHDMYDKVSPSPPTLMHPWRIAILGSWEVGMAILRGFIKVGGEGDTLSYIPWSGRIVTPSDSCMDEVNNLRGSILRGYSLCDTHFCRIRCDHSRSQLYVWLVMQSVTRWHGSLFDWLDDFTKNVI
jgi:hypothetical protein